MAEREVAVKKLFEIAAKQYNEPTIYDMRLNTYDRGEPNSMEKVYAFCYNTNIPEMRRFCGPDWTFQEWPSASIHNFEASRDAIISSGNLPPIFDKVGWIGNIYSPRPDVPEYYTRVKLYNIGKKFNEIFDIINIVPKDGIIDSKIDGYKSIQYLTKYKYLIDIGGNGYSGRLKYLLFSHRPIFLVDRIYIEYFHNDLKPYIHYIPVKMDLSDLLDQFMWAMNNPKKAAEIAENAFRFATENFTREKLCDRIYYVWKNINDINN